MTVDNKYPSRFLLLSHYSILYYKCNQILRLFPFILVAFYFGNYSHLVSVLCFSLYLKFGHEKHIKSFVTFMRIQNMIV